MCRDVNFQNNGHEFNIALTTSGDLSFLANGNNGAGERRMVIRDSENEVRFDGRVLVETEVQVGGDGDFGAVQLNADDGGNTIFLGSTEVDASMLLGGGGRNGRVQVFDNDGNSALDLQAASALLIVGSEGNDGDILVKDDTGNTTIHVDGQSGQVMLKPDTLSAPRLTLDGLLGEINLFNASGTRTIRLSGEDGTIEFFDSSGAPVLTLP